MKNYLFAFAVKSIAALVVTNAAYAQTTINVEVLEPKDAITSDKAIAVGVKKNAVNLNAISLKAVRNFKKSYKMVSNENWSKAPDGFNASFTLDGIKNLLYYDKKGRWVGSLKVYAEDKLDRKIRDIVKREYYDYKITSIDEVETVGTYGIPAYIVHLEDSNSIKLIRVMDGVMDVYKDLSKL